MPVWTAWLVGCAGLVLGAAGCVGLAVVEWTAWVLVLPGRRPGASSISAGLLVGPGAGTRPGYGSPQPPRGVLEIRNSRSYRNACSLCCIESCNLFGIESFQKKIGVSHFLNKKF